MDLTCSQCGAIGTEHFTYKTKGGPKPFPRCKGCHNSYTKKGTGWAKVPDETKEIVLSMLADRRNKIADIAKATNISAANLGRWIANGSLMLVTPN